MSQKSNPIYRINKLTRKLARELFLKWRSPGRYLIERKIFPKIKNKKVLWVGCAHYTKDYIDRLRKNQIWTIDIDPKVSKYGAINHIVGSATDLDKYYEKNFFDIIFFIGIFGYGLNLQKESEKAIRACHKVLKKGGILIIQWSNIPGKNPINPIMLKNSKLFEKKSMFGYPETFKTRDGKGIFNFWKKPIKN